MSNTYTEADLDGRDDLGHGVVVLPSESNSFTDSDEDEENQQDGVFVSNRSFAILIFIAN